MTTEINLALQLSSSVDGKEKKVKFFLSASQRHIGGAGVSLYLFVIIAPEHSEW
jgi:hypothetical protein